MDRTAVCGCGQLSVTVRGEPGFHGLCSCLECQKASGSAFSYSGYWPKAAVQGIAGTSTVWRRISAKGRWLDTYFCPVCGSAVYGYAEFAPDMINVAIGNLADPGFPPPQYAVWNENKHPWVHVPEACAQHQKGGNA
ncbi:MAG: GFA family protein [Alphaproteobacteria bacterium]